MRATCNCRCRSDHVSPCVRRRSPCPSTRCWLVTPATAATPTATSPTCRAFLAGGIRGGVLHHLAVQARARILKWLVAKPSTDAQAAELAQGERESFAAWTVEATRAEPAAAARLPGQYAFLADGRSRADEAASHGCISVPAVVPRHDRRRRNGRLEPVASARCWDFTSAIRARCWPRRAPAAATTSGG